MRVVLDTNILARAASPSHGPARDVLIRCTHDPHVILISAFIVSELSRVLRYDRVRTLHGLDEAAIDRYVEAIQKVSVTVMIPETEIPSVVPHDADDDPIIATAFAGHADVLCTLDRHLLHPTVRSHGEARGLRILTDTELLAILRIEKPDRT